MTFPGPLSALRTALQNWYAAHRRDLPWRATDDPYAIWISEVMLQQTTVAAVIPYWTRFVTELPDVPALAAADEDRVLRLWSGLGYYRRARNLQAAARQVVAAGGTALPADPAGLRALPGIGAYTAAAIASIAHGVAEPVIDGNVQRVLSRLGGIEGDPRRAAAARRIEQCARGLLDPRRPGDWNQAVMELGATVCTPRSPDCGECPWASWCVARGAGLVDRIPTPQQRPSVVDVVRGAALIEDGTGRQLLARVPPGEANAGLWELPAATLFHGSRDGGSPPARWSPRLAARLRDALSRAIGCDATVGPVIARVAHAITHHRIVIHLVRATLAKDVVERDGLRWCPVEDVAREALTGAARKLLARVGSQGSSRRRAGSHPPPP